MTHTPSVLNYKKKNNNLHLLKNQLSFKIYQKNQLCFKKYFNDI